jgi:Apea-like HEPN
MSRLGDPWPTRNQADMDYQALKLRQRSERDSHPPNLALRAHRALSWLNRAEQLAEDRDGHFIFLWIAFNAAYATDLDEKYRTSERAIFRDFLQKLISLDKGKTIEQLVWNEFSGSIRLLLDNRYIYQDFWNYRNGKLTETEWQRNFADANKAARTALAQRDTSTVLSIVLSRLYTLRNQLMHGGATWNSSVNRDQIKDCANLLGKLVPLVIEIMMDNVSTLWGDACYPVVD